MMKMKFIGTTLAMAALVLPAAATVAEAQPSARSQQVMDYWTPARIKQAIPRQLVIAPNGLGYLKLPDGSLQPHGHAKLVELTDSTKQPRAKPGTGSDDSQGPSITPIEPADGETIGASQRFAATVTDPDGVRSVTLVITYPDGRTQSFSMSNFSGDTWESSLSGFTTGEGWSWHLEAKDATRGKGNVTVSDSYFFDVVTSAEPPPVSGDVVVNEHWPDDGGLIQLSVGRIYFEMPTNARLKRWAAYVCSGTVASDGDGTDGRSIIITAAHCAYDDANKAFARNVLFIPDQDGTTGTGTDTNCSNDPLGCWAPDFAVVDTNWTLFTFPDNIPWDYAYYVVDDSSAHTGSGAGGSLETAVGGLSINFDTPAEGDRTHAIGYSYADDPNLMYCAEDMTREGAYNWWLPNCGLSGGSSGGPWVQPTPEGEELIISVNSWGYTGSPGMAGPFLDVTSAACLFVDAVGTGFGEVPDADGQQGVVVTCN